MLFPGLRALRKLKLDSGHYTAGGFDCQWAGKLEFLLTRGLAVVVLLRRGLIMRAAEWLAGVPRQAHSLAFR